MRLLIFKDKLFIKSEPEAVPTALEWNIFLIVPPFEVETFVGDYHTKVLALHQ